MENILKKKRKLKLEKGKMKIFNFLCKLTTYSKFDHKNFSPFWYEILVFILIDKIFPKMSDKVWGYLRDFYCF